MFTEGKPRLHETASLDRGLLWQKSRPHAHQRPLLHSFVDQSSYSFGGNVYENSCPSCLPWCRPSDSPRSALHHAEEKMGLFMGGFAVHCEVRLPLSHLERQADLFLSSPFGALAFPLIRSQSRPITSVRVRPSISLLLSCFLEVRDAH